MTGFGEARALVQNPSPNPGPEPFIERRANLLRRKREQLPWPKDRPFRILSLDGGGIKGLYSASVLQFIEAELGEPGALYQYFDMIAGTSTGGILGIAVSLGKPADRMKSLYVLGGREIFPPWRYKLSRCTLVRLVFGVLYDYRKLERLIYAEFGDATLGDCRTRMVIPAFMIPKAEITVFKTDHHPDFKNDYKMKAWEVARATAAAPTYFRGHDRGTVMFIDGGVWANNPIMVALVDSLSSYDVEKGQIEILSIGTGNQPWEISKMEARGGIYSWKTVIGGAMYLTADNALAQAGLLIGPERITRIEPSGNAANIDIDDWCGAVKVLPDAAAGDFAKNKDSIMRFFVAKVAPRHRFY